MPKLDVSKAAFRKSTYSDATGCVEAASLAHLRLVRDSKDPGGPVLTFTPSAWAVFVGEVKSGGLDL